MVMCPYFIGIILTRIAKYLIVNDKFLRGNKSAKTNVAEVICVNETII